MKIITKNKKFFTYRIKNKENRKNNKDHQILNKS